MNKYISLDLGIKSLGIAYSDSLGIVHNYENFNFEVYNYKKAREKVIQVSKELDIKDIVIGFPLQLDREEGERCKSVRRFVEDIKKEDETLNFILFDESFTTIEAKERLLDSGVKSKYLSKYIDMMSAYILLEDYLRSLDNGKD